MASINKDAKEVVALESQSTPSTVYSGIFSSRSSSPKLKSIRSRRPHSCGRSSGLPDMMAECGSNVKAFNQEVRSIQRN
jgi:hypothetical protein